MPFWLRLLLVITAFSLLPASVPGAPAYAASSGLLQGTPPPRLPLPDELPFWQESVLVAGGFLLLFGIDDEVQESIRGSAPPPEPTPYSRLTRTFGEPPVYASICGGILVTGILTGDERWRDAGARVGLSLAMAGLVTGGVKYLAGRPRPSSYLQSHKFRPFSGLSSFPSGHATMAFALATSLAQEIDRRWASMLLYTLAVGTASGRVVENLHWQSDVVAGALIGHCAARLVRARILRPGDSIPDLTLTPAGPAVAWRMSF